MNYRAGRAVSQLAGLLGPAALSAPWSGLRPLLSIPQPVALRACRMDKEDQRKTLAGFLAKLL